MKVTKDGKVKLDKGEVRVGNFFVRDEGENKHIKVADLNSCFTIRVDKSMPLGIWLDNMLKLGDKGHETIRTWCSAMWAVLSVAPDQEYVVGLVDAADANLKRHPDWYGYNPTDDDEANERAAQEVKEMKEFEEEIKNIDDNVHHEEGNDPQRDGIGA